MKTFINLLKFVSPDLITTAKCAERWSVIYYSVLGFAKFIYLIEFKCASSVHEERDVYKRQHAGNKFCLAFPTKI